MEEEPTTPSTRLANTGSSVDSFNDSVSEELSTPIHETTSSKLSPCQTPIALKGVTINSFGVKIDHKEATTINKVSGANLDTYISYSKEETIAFSTHINNCLTDDALVARHFPLDVESDDIFLKLGPYLYIFNIL